MSKLRTRLLLAAAAAGALLIGAPAAAHATPAQDAQFYTLLGNVGIAPTVLSTAYAHNVCANVWAGSSPWTEVSRIYSAGGLDWDSATRFVTAAILVYCPPAGTNSGTPAPSGGLTV
ncbi:MAG TPA: DUF732 domain-containing protein [Mycobacterium sp.]|nr:DUF732 domain-containing protein [Mycobacterium sp.]